MELSKDIDQVAQAAKGFGSREEMFENDDVHLKSRQVSRGIRTPYLWEDKSFDDLMLT
jgi:hypothetical protein